MNVISDSELQSDFFIMRNELCKLREYFINPSMMIERMTNEEFFELAHYFLEEIKREIEEGKIK